jgi:ABC-type multidrug transport system fused ATPase/permease subunit
MASHDKPTSDADREQDAPASEAAPSSEAAPPSMAPLSQEGPVVKTGGKKRKKHAETAVRLKNVSRRFGAHTAVNNVSLRIRGGSVYGLIGPNGAGKTTTFSMMAGYLTPSEGQVEILGFSPTDVPSLRGRLGVLPQDAMLPGADKVGEFLVHMGRLQGLNPEQAEQEAREGLKEVARWHCAGLSWRSRGCAAR